MTFHPSESAQLVALRQASYLEAAAKARMVPRRSSSLRRRLAALLRRRGRRAALHVDAIPSTSPLPVVEEPLTPLLIVEDPLTPLLIVEEPLT